VITDTRTAAGLRDALVVTLREQGRIVSPVVEAAFRAVAREAFLPEGTDLAVAYEVDKAVVTKRDEHGAAMSSVSAAYIQARMLEQAELQPGSRVLEIGSGGLNAAYAAEIVGVHGTVVSVDIDPEVTARAVALLEANGYAGRVRVVTADAGQVIPGEGVFDAIIVTVGAHDIAPVWLRHLTAAGRLVLPLIMNGVTRTIGFRRDGDHLVSTSLEVAGFVPLQGAGRRDDHVVVLAGANGTCVRLRFDTAPADPGQLDGVLTQDPVVVWSAVTFPDGMSWSDLYLWFAWHLPGFCQCATDDADGRGQPGMRFPVGVTSGRGFAYLVVRSALQGAGVEFGAAGHGDDGEDAATAMVEQIRAWDRHGRHSAPVLSYWPKASDRAQIPAGTAVMAKAHGVLTASWPATT
jgi:protein-L-isoaspartate(D-aspartate) O-methyltransferase